MDYFFIAIGGAFICALIFFGLTRRPHAHDAALLAHIDALQKQHSEMVGRLGALSETQEKARGELSRTLNERLDHLTQNVTVNLRENSEKTGKTLGELGQRLALIDQAQEKITALSGQVVNLQHILDNKQARGSFGEIRLNDLVRDALPQDAYKLQTTLSNNKRADCLILLPDPPGPIVVDSKFPLEAFQAMRVAENADAAKAALKQLSDNTLRHARAIAEKYLIPGETAEAALMFLPSESIFSELHLSLPDTIQKCRDMRIYPVSPNTMWLTLNTVRAIMRDVEMHKQASHIQAEVRHLMEDVSRLSERVNNLKRHFNQAEADIKQIETSSGKVLSRGEKITNVELDNVEEISKPALPENKN